MYLNYEGDLTKDVIGRIMGPDKFGAYYEAIRAEYIFRTDMTRVKFRPLTKDDQRDAVTDDFGELRVVDTK